LQQLGDNLHQTFTNQVATSPDSYRGQGSHTRQEVIFDLFFYL